MKPVLIRVFAFGAMILASPLVNAEDYDEKIQALQKQLEAVQESIREGQRMLVEIEGELADLKHQVNPDSSTTDSEVMTAPDVNTSAGSTTVAAASDDAKDGRVTIQHIWGQSKNFCAYFYSDPKYVIPQI